MGVSSIVLSCVLSLGFVVNRNLIPVEMKELMKIRSCCFCLFDYEEEAEDPDRYISLNLMSLDQKGNAPARTRKKNFVIPQPVPKNKIEDGTREIKKIPLPNIDVSDLEIGFEEGEEEIVIRDTCDCFYKHQSNPIKQEAYPDSLGFIFISSEEPQPLNHHEILNDVKKELDYPGFGCLSVEGTVVIRVLVDKCGNYKKHKVLKEIHPIFSEACEEHIHKLKFTPPMDNGNPICFWVNIPFRFKVL